MLLAGNASRCSLRVRSKLSETSFRFCELWTGCGGRDQRLSTDRIRTDTGAGEIPMSVILELQSWFAGQCNGEWEHRKGVAIQSCDNPGWWVKVGLVGTYLEGKEFAPVTRGDLSSLDPAPPWLRCYVEDGVFNGAGDPSTLEEILEIFLSWAK